MDRRGWHTIALVVLVATAGCAGFASNDGAPDRATATPTATPPDTPTPTVAPVEATGYPPGWTSSGVNASLARDSHYAAVLAGPSTTVTYRSVVVESSGGPRRNTTLDMRLDPAERRLYASIDGKTNHRTVFFADRTLSQWDVRNETLVGQSNARFEGVAQSIDRGVLYSHLLLYDIEFERTVRRQGRTALVYNVTDAYNSTTSNTYGTATDATGHVVVATDGRVLEIETTVTYGKGTLRYRYAHRQLGETDVTRPEWLRNT
jgi:hypothetical protein